MISRFSDPSALWMSIRLSQFHLISWRMHVRNRYFNWMITDLHMRMVGNHHSHPFTTALPLISINSTSKTSYSCLKENGPTMFSRWLFRVPGIYQVIWKARKSHVFDVFWARGSHHRAAFWCNFVAVRVFFGFQRCCTSFDIWAHMRFWSNKNISPT